jgi:multidrug efflux pump subunit AcrA (membrane-fusion protein)
MSEPRGRPLLTFALGALCVGVVVAGVVVVGPPSQSSAQTRTVTARRGVVQATVSGSGNIEAASELDLGFKTSGVVGRVYVHQGERVSEGRLLAELDPESAEVALEQARAALQAAKANLAQVEETGGGGSSAKQDSTLAGSAGVKMGGEAGKRSTPGRGANQAAASQAKVNQAEASQTEASQATVSQATREANIASARAAVKSDRLTVRGDEQALADTKLYAPETGTIVALNGEVGETVSGSGITKAGASGGSSSGAGGSGSGGSGTGSGASGSGSSGSGSSGSSSTFAVLSDLSSMQLVVALSESEISSVKAGQPATVTIEALEGRKLAAHVASVAILPTSSSGVVSYDVTFDLDQGTGGLRPGMSATAEVVVRRAEGVNVPTSAISGGTVTVIRDGKEVRENVVTGLAGASSTIILSGVSAGEQVVLPIARAGSPTSGLGKFAGRGVGGAAGIGGGGAAGIGGGGAALGGGGGGGAIFFRGGG